MSKKQVKEQSAEKPMEAPAPRTKGRVFTYVGGGEDSPRVINFMGMQKFVRGQATEVVDPVVLAKIAKNPTFIEGEVEQEELHTYDEEARKEADEQRRKDKETNLAWKKKYNKE